MNDLTFDQILQLAQKYGVSPEKMASFVKQLSKPKMATPVGTPTDVYSPVKPVKIPTSNAISTNVNYPVSTVSNLPQKVEPINFKVSDGGELSNTLRNMGKTVRNVTGEVIAPKMLEHNPLMKLGGLYNGGHFVDFETLEKGKQGLTDNINQALIDERNSGNQNAKELMGKMGVLEKKTHVEDAANSDIFQKDLSKMGGQVIPMDTKEGAETQADRLASMFNKEETTIERLPEDMDKEPEQTVVPEENNNEEKRNIVKRINDGISKLKATGTTPEANATSDLMERLNAAQKADAASVLQAQMLMAGNTIGAGIANVKADQSGADALMKTAGRGVAGLKEEIDTKEIADKLKDKENLEKLGGKGSLMANSLIAAINRQMGTNIPEGSASVEQISKMTGMDMNKLATFAQQEKLLKIKQNEINAIKEIKEQKSSDDKENNDYIKMSDRFMKMTSSARGAVAREAAKANVALHIKALLNQYPDKSKMPAVIADEVATSFDNLISMNASTVSGREALSFKGLGRDFSKWGNYALNRPPGGISAEYVNLIGDSIDRQVEVSNKIMDRSTGGVIAGFRHLEKKNPERFNKAVYELSTALGIEPEGKKEETSSSTSKTPNTKTVLKKYIDRKNQKTKFVYSDGSEEEVQGIR